MTWPILTPVRLRMLSNTAGGDPPPAQRQLEWNRAAADAVWRPIEVNGGVAVAFGASGATSVAGGSATAPIATYPTGITKGQQLILFVANKPDTVTPATPAGWTVLATATGGTGAQAADTGPTRGTLFGKEADGTETGTFTVTLTGNSSAGVKILRYAKTTGKVWSLAVASGSDSTAGTAWSAAASSNPDVRAGDILLVCSAPCSDCAVASQAISQAGVTFGTFVNRENLGITTGNDTKVLIDEFPVTTGTGGTGNPTLTFTASGTGSATESGVSLFLRIRQVDAPIQFFDSANITGGGTTATTAQLSAPVGKTFSPGDISDDTNPLPTLDLPNNGYTEDEWCIQATATAQLTEVYQFRVTLAGTPLNTYSQTPSWTIGAALNNYTLTTTAGSYGLTTPDQNLRLGRMLTTTAGSHVLTGTAQTLLPTRLLTGDIGSYAVTGQSQDLLLGHVLSTAIGAYALTGVNPSLLRALRLDAGSGSLLLTGTDSTLTYTIPGGFIVIALSGSYVLQGTDSTLLATRSLIPAVGSYLSTGTDPTLLKASVLVPTSGVYTLTGTALDMLYGRILSASFNTYLMLGTVLNVIRHTRASPDIGIYLLSGTAASLTPSSTYTLRPIIGRYWLADNPSEIKLAWDTPTEDALGNPLTDLAGYKLYYGTAPGVYGAPVVLGLVNTYTITGLNPSTTYYISIKAVDTIGNESAFAPEIQVRTGTPVSLLWKHVVGPTAGSYGLTGTDLSALWKRLLVPLAGSYATTGSPTTFLISRMVVPDPGTYTHLGQPLSALMARVLVPASTSYSVTGTAVSLFAGHLVVPVSGLYNLTGTTTPLLHTALLVPTSGIYTQTGTPATLSYSALTVYILSTLPGTYGYTGTNATLLINRLIPIPTEAGTYLVQGQVANLLWKCILVAEEGTYELTGTDADLIPPVPPPSAYVLQPASGLYLLQGTASDLISTGALHAVLTAGQGFYTLQGFPATLLWIMLPGEGGGYVPIPLPPGIILYPPVGGLPLEPGYMPVD